VLVINASYPANTMAELVARVKGKSGKLNNNMYQSAVIGLGMLAQPQEVEKGDKKYSDALLAYFQRVPLPPEFATDKLVPYFMSLAFPAGAVGLVIAAIMAASLSSIDSAHLFSPRCVS